MLYRLDAKKGRGLDDLISSLTPSPLEEISAPKQYGKTPFSLLIEKLEEYLQIRNSMNQEPYIKFPSTKDTFYLQNTVTEILPPAMINGFVQLVPPYISSTSKRDLSRFLTHLIQQSYDAGYNQFYLDTTDVEKLQGLGATLKGKSKRPLEINVDGPISDYFLNNAKKVVATLKTQSEPMFTGHRAKKIHLTITGPAGVHTGVHADYSSFVIQGEPSVDHAGYGLGMDARFSSFRLESFGTKKYWPFGEVAFPFGCTFKTNTPETMDNILQYLPLGNRAIFIHPDGTEET